jgi:endonuclease/exonuclease/phosphatase family metal-dependent hydrolase
MMRLSIACLSVLSLAALTACSDDTTQTPQDGSPRDAAVDTRPGVDSVGRDLQLGPPVSVKLATFNLHNFFDGENDPNKDDDVPKASEVDDKVARVGAALRRLDADVVALQEIENRPLLDRLVKEQLAQLGYDHVHLQPGNDPRGINVALLSRFPVLRVTSHANDFFKGLDPGDSKNYRFSRDCLEVEIEPSKNRKLTVLVNHLRANDNSQLATRTREAQAQRVREIVDAILKWTPDANIAVVGDLNDGPESRTLKLIRDGAPALKELLAGKSINQRYTTFYKGQKTQIDYILTSSGLTADLQAGSAAASHEAVYSAASDHFPVLATFRVE